MLFIDPFHRKFFDKDLPFLLLEQKSLGSAQSALALLELLKALSDGIHVIGVDDLGVITRLRTT